MSQMPTIPETATKVEVARLRLEVQLEQVERRWREAQDKLLGFGKYGNRYKPGAWRAYFIGGFMALMGVLFILLAIYAMQHDVKARDGSAALGLVFGIVFAVAGIFIAILGGKSEASKAAALESARVQYEQEKQVAREAIQQLKSQP